MDYIEMTGRTAEEAVEKALKMLEAKPEEVIVTVLEQGAKGYLGIGQKPAKVSVKLKDDPMRLARQFIRSVSRAMGLDVAVDIELTDGAMSIDLKGANMGILIGKHGQTLDSLQYLTNLVVNKNTENYVNIQLDTENYREKRRETLESLARNMAKKARQIRKPVKLEPMSPSERRVIHATLQGEKNITTYSEGVEPYRNVVVAPRREHTAHSAPQGTAAGGERPKPSHKPYGQNRYGKGIKPNYPKTDNYKKFISVSNESEGETRKHDDGDDK